MKTLKISACSKKLYCQKLRRMFSKDLPLDRNFFEFNQSSLYRVCRNEWQCHTILPFLSSLSLSLEWCSLLSFFLLRALVQSVPLMNGRQLIQPFLYIKEEVKRKNGTLPFIVTWFGRGWGLFKLAPFLKRGLAL